MAIPYRVASDYLLRSAFGTALIYILACGKYELVSTSTYILAGRLDLAVYIKPYSTSLVHVVSVISRFILSSRSQP